jgi:hypothetical protein
MRHADRPRTCPFTGWTVYSFACPVVCSRTS